MQNNTKIRPCLDCVAYDLRRAAEERRKAQEAIRPSDREGRLLIAEMFEERADAALTAGLMPVPAPGELLPTLH